MIDTLKKYIENRIHLVRLELVSTLANIGASLVSSFLILVMAMFIVLIFSFALAYWFGQKYESDGIGFAIVGGIYVLIFIIYLAFAKKAIDTKVKDKIVKTALSGREDLIDNDENF
ncbi:MAG: phage holin family protein [Bacteroidota bacterium]